MVTPVRSPCILWVGATRNGYGVRHIGGKVHYVHRMVCAAVYPPPFPGALALHRCNERACYNPDHLYWGDRRQNAEDSRRAGTMALGEKHGQALLTVKQVRNIRASKLSSYKLAVMMGVPASTIRSARNRTNWKSV